MKKILKSKYKIVTYHIGNTMKLERITYNNQNKIRLKFEQHFQFSLIYYSMKNSLSSKKVKFLFDHWQLFYVNDHFSSKIGKNNLFSGKWYIYKFENKLFYVVNYSDREKKILFMSYETQTANAKLVINIQPRHDEHNSQMRPK